MKHYQKFFFACILLPFTSIAQINVDTGKEIVTPANAEVMRKKLNEFIDKEKNDTIESTKFIVPPYSADKRLDSPQLLAWQNYYSYMTHGYKHRKNVFSWQLVSSKIIFFVVIFLVLMGIYFAWLQFIHVLRKRDLTKTLAEELRTELTASGKEIKVSSPVLGVIILLISLMFFFLYLKYVYPIIETF